MRDNRTLLIATAPSRVTKRWRNTETSWSAFVERLRQPVRTAETVKEYRAMSKSEQGEVKDVGGFVGGHLIDGTRKRGSCDRRSLITLDADNPDEHFLDVCEFLGEECVIYSTHSHTERAARYRLIIPLAREVSAEEYTPLALAIARTLGLDNFDKTTYQPERLMYYPSCSRDAKYFFKHLTEETALDPDEWLASSYNDWRDASAWPLADVAQPRDIERQGDPLSKPGVVGAFNRAFTIDEAIARFLPDVYKPASRGRYTYREGSTFGGLVVYDEGLFAYSNHATDPASSRLCNAYDLVRLHLYGAQDATAAPDTPISKLPSSVAMRDFVTSLDEVRHLMATERMTEAAQDFGITVETDEAATEWTKQLTFTRSGNIESTSHNIEVIMNNDPALVDMVRLDTFERRAVLVRSTPWREVSGRAYWSDADDAGLRVYLENVYGIAARAKIEDALTLALEKRSTHPVREYLESLTWDGIPRLDSLLIDYLGAADNEYTRTVTRKFLVATVARVMQPGCKFDHMLVLTGAQGLGKTLLAQKLAGRWFSNTLDTVQGKEAYEALEGVWIMEMGELTATKKADIEAVKHFISKTEDAFRVAYGRRKSYFPRQCTFMGTTNDAVFLRDRTGNRRFWPVGVRDTGERNVWDLTQETVDAIWAEALCRYRDGEALYLNAQQEELAAYEQALRLEDNGIEGVIADYLSIPITDDWYSRNIADRRRYIEQYGEGEYAESGETPRERVCVLEVWCEALGHTPGTIRPINASEIRAALNALGDWRKYSGGDRGRLRFGRGYDKQVAWVSLNAAEK